MEVRAINIDGLTCSKKLKKDKIYTVREVISIQGHLFLYLKEIRNNNTMNLGGIDRETPFHYARFCYNDDRNYVLDYEEVKKWYNKFQLNGTV